MTKHRFHVGPTSNINPDYHFSVACPPPTGAKAFPIDFRRLVKNNPRTRNTLKLMPNERAMLCYLTAQLHSADPDVIVGHNIRGFDLDVLTHRMEQNKVPLWSKVRMV